MKHILESEEIFKAYTTIDACYFGLKMLNEELDKPQSGIEVMIDRSTGFDKAKMKQWKETSISLLEQIIEAKKIIEADYEKDIITLNEIKALK